MNYLRKLTDWLFQGKDDILTKLDKKTVQNVVLHIAKGESCKVEYEGKSYLFVPHTSYRCYEIQ